jgi:hypothetical protein
MNLQFFAEDVVEDDNPLDADEPGEETEAETDADESDESEAETEKPEKETTKPVKQDKPKIKVKYMQEEKELEYDEAVTYAQKGMNYDKVHEKMTGLEKKAQKLMSITGMDFDKALEHLEKEKLRIDAENLADKESITVDEARARLREQQANKEIEKIRFSSTVEKQKEPLREKIYFKELEPEIDKMVQEGIENGNIVNVDVAYNYLRGLKLEELMSKNTDAVKKGAIADMQDKLKRGVPTSSDSGQKNTTTINVNKQMAAIFGNDPKEIAQYKAEKLKRR